MYRGPASCLGASHRGCHFEGLFAPQLVSLIGFTDRESTNPWCASNMYRSCCCCFSAAAVTHIIRPTTHTKHSRETAPSIHPPPQPPTLNKTQEESWSSTGVYSTYLLPQHSLVPRPAGPQRAQMSANTLHPRCPPSRHRQLPPRPSPSPCRCRSLRRRQRLSGLIWRGVEGPEAGRDQEGTQSE